MEGDFSRPQGPAKELEGNQARNEEDSGTHRYPDQRFPGKAGNELADPGEKKGSVGQRTQISATGTQGMESLKRMSCPWSPGRSGS